jgi:hypothetical protein
MTPLLAHDPAGSGPTPHETGSVLYDVLPDHAPALAVLLLAPPAALVAWRWRRRLPLGRLPLLLGRLAPERAVAVAVLALSALVHAALVPTHGWSARSLLYVLAAGLLAGAAHRLLHGRRLAGTLAATVLLGSMLGLAVAAATGDVPDQVAMATKLVELLGLVALWSPVAAGRWRRLAGGAGAAAAAVVVVVPVWGAALDPGDATDGHHGGRVAAGTLLPPSAGAREATAEQRRAAGELWRETAAAIAPYADPAVAAEAGYRVAGLAGTGFHAEHPGHASDGRLLDPRRPETLVYAETDGGPVLLGAMFTAEEVAAAGPRAGGPLTPWHRHEQVCFSLLPPAVVGLTSPWGACPAGSLTVARTEEMLHVWTVPGAPEPFGDLPEEWLAEHLGS